MSLDPLTVTLDDSDHDSDSDTMAGSGDASLVFAELLSTLYGKFCMKTLVARC